MSNVKTITSDEFEKVRAAICKVYDGRNVMGNSICEVTNHQKCRKAAAAVVRALSCRVKVSK